MVDLDVLAEILFEVVQKGSFVVLQKVGDNIFKLFKVIIFEEADDVSHRKKEGVLAEDLGGEVTLLGALEFFKVLLSKVRLSNTKDGSMKMVAKSKQVRVSSLK